MSHKDLPRKKPARVSEPVQVYLAPPDLDRLSRLAEALQASKSDVLRRGLAALEAQRRRLAEAGATEALPTFAGAGLQPGVSLDDSRALRDRMDALDDDA